MKIVPAKRLRGEVARLPGDKSVSHRAALLAALAGGPTRVSNFSTSADCASTLGCLAALGVGVRREGEAAVLVEGAGRGPGEWSFRGPDGALDCGNSGTTMRLLAGVLAAQGFAATLTGDESLSRRPMRRVVGPLELMGARLSTEDGHAPLRVEGRRPLRAIEYATPVASAQVKSCVLLAGLGAEGRTTVTEPEPTRDHTERLLDWLGVPVAVSAAPGGGQSGRHSVTVEGLKGFAARDVEVPGDISSAAFLVAAAALLPGSEVSVRGVGLNPTRAQVLGTMRMLGADLSVEEEGERSNEPVGRLVARGGEGLRPTSAGANVVGGRAVARLIDELPVLAVVGARVEGGLEIRDAAELRVKESDRIRAVVSNLRAMGAEVEELPDGLRVAGPQRLRGARLSSFGDHRIAMAFAVAALSAEGDTVIDGAEECVGVSFPDFFPLLESLAER